MKTVVVSGAGSGIGRAIVQELGNRPDFRLVLVGRTQKTLDATLATLVEPVRHTVVVADTSSKTDLRTGLSAALGGHKDLYAVLANAGVGGENHYGDDDRWDEIIRTNLTGTYTLVQECLPYFKNSEHEWKHILATSSILARIGVPGYSAYCASKAGILGLIRSLAVGLSSQKILVNALCPGWVDTEMSKEGIEGIHSRAGSSVQY